MLSGAFIVFMIPEFLLAKVTNVPVCFQYVIIIIGM